jgi:hypothetical protein
VPTLSLVRKLKIKLESSSSISITTDSTYLTRQNVPYIAITGHFIDDDFRLHEAVLSVFVAQQSETSDYITKQLKYILHDRFKLSGKLHCIVTDEGANFLGAATSLKTAEIIPESLRLCMSSFSADYQKINYGKIKFCSS